MTPLAPHRQECGDLKLIRSGSDSAYDHPFFLEQASTAELVGCIIAQVFAASQRFDALSLGTEQLRSVVSALDAALSKAKREHRNQAALSATLGVRCGSLLDLLSVLSALSAQLQGNE